MNTSSQTKNVDALIVGAGFSGIALLQQLRSLNYNVQILEASSGLGGTWHNQRYPGLRVDCALSYYGFSDPAIWRTYDWNEKFPSQATLSHYFDHVDKIWSVRPVTSLDTRVVSAKWSDAAARWTIEDSNAQIWTAKFFLPATGSTYIPHIPRFPGLAGYKGRLVHPSQWPADLDTKGKRIVVIGAGATAIQLVTALAPDAAHLTQVIRTPNYALPLRQQEFTSATLPAVKDNIEADFKLMRSTPKGLPFLPVAPKTMAVSAAERERIWTERWAEGGFEWSGGSFADLTICQEGTALAYDFWRRQVSARITGRKAEAKRALLAPKEPPYPFMSKRPALERGYYEAVSRENVDVVGGGARGFTATCVLTDEGAVEADIVIAATGYDALTGSLLAMDIQGRRGSLREHWASGTKTYLGLMAAGFPNMFFPYGPQAPTSLTSGPCFIEMQAEVVRDLIKGAASRLAGGDNSGDKTQLPIVEATPEAEGEWVAFCEMLMNMTVVSKGDSWYNGANVEGKRREALVFCGGIQMYMEKADAARHQWAGMVQPVSSSVAAAQSDTPTTAPPAPVAVSGPVSSSAQEDEKATKSTVTHEETGAQTSPEKQKKSKSKKRDDSWLVWVKRVVADFKGRMGSRSPRGWLGDGAGGGVAVR